MFGKLATVAFLSLLLVQDPPLNSYFLKNQQVLNGEVQAVDGERVTLKVAMFGGTAVITRNLSDFTPDSACMILSQQSKDTVDDRLKVATYAANAGVEYMARREFKAAYAIATKANNEAQQMEVKKVAADVVEKIFKQCIAKNDVQGARKFLDILVIRLADTRTEAQRAGLVAMMDELETKDVAARKAAEEAQEEKTEAANRASLLKPIDALIKQGQQYNSTGLSNSGSAAKQAYDNAIQNYVQAYQQLTGLQKSNASDKILQDKISSTLVHLISIGIQTCMNAASMLMTQTDYQGAMEYVNKALKVDPKNEDALEMRTQIQQASSSSGNGWGWGWGRPIARPRGR